MRARLKIRLWNANLLLVVLASLSCGKPKAPAVGNLAPDAFQTANSDPSRAIPRRANPLIVTNVVLPDAEKAAEVQTNNPPTITCGAAQTFPCSSADGLQATLTVHVEDPDGDALSVIWSADGKERYTQQVPAGEPSTSADLTFQYTFTPGDHGVTVFVSDGALSATCDSSVTVQKDTQEPVIVCPKDISVPPDPGQCTALVTFTVKATDNCPDVTVVADPPSGTAFPIGVTTVTCSATDIAGNVATCAFDVAVRITNLCPRNDVFWRQNPGAWPVNFLVLGNQTYSKSQLQSLLHAAAPGDASVLLARQLIAAGLNTARGSDPRPICGELADAHGLLSGFSGKLPFRVNQALPDARQMMALATRLNAYNNALLTPNCVP